MSAAEDAEKEADEDANVKSKFKSMMKMIKEVRNVKTIVNEAKSTAERAAASAERWTFKK